MATLKSSRVARASAHSRPIPEDRTAPKRSIPQPVHRHLSELIHVLREIEGMTIVARHALRESSEATGPYVANLLRKHVSNQLSLEADRLAVLLGLKQHEDDSVDEDA